MLEAPLRISKKHVRELISQELNTSLEHVQVTSSPYAKALKIASTPGQFIRYEIKDMLSNRRFVSVTTGLISVAAATLLAFDIGYEKFREVD